MNLAQDDLEVAEEDSYANQYHQTGLIQLQNILEVFKIASNVDQHCPDSANQLQGGPYIVKLAAINSKLSPSSDSNATYYQ